MEEVADTSEGCATLQKDLNRWERWTEKNIVKFNKGKFNLQRQVLHLGKNNPMHQHNLKSSFARIDLGILVYKNLSMSQQCILGAKETNGALGHIMKSAANRAKDVILYSALVKMHMK